jgi:hypothetical protein
MSRTFVKKEGMALVYLARYLLGEQPSNRLKTIDELSTDFTLSVGVVQNALKVLESNHCMALERRGRNGTLLKWLDYQALLQQADIGNLVCAMPLPYTRLYEGLASGLKIQFGSIPLYYAHMRGADVRIECLIDGVYDMALVSRLAAEDSLQQGKIRILLTLGSGSYVHGHQMICQREKQQKIRRVGLDPRSPDQRLLTDLFFQQQPIERVEIPYHECLQRIEKGDIDAAIWNTSRQVLGEQLVAIELHDNPNYLLASEAVLLARSDDRLIQQLTERLLNRQALLQHQQDVENGKIEPSY